MTDTAKDEQALRDKLKAKSQQRRESQTSRVEGKGETEVSQRKEDKDPSPLAQQQRRASNNTNGNRGGEDSRFGGGWNGQRPGYRNGHDRNFHRGGGGHPHPHHQRPPPPRGGGRDDWRRNEVDFYGRGPPPPHLRGGSYNNIDRPPPPREYEQDRYGREIRRERRRSRSVSRSRSYSSRSDEDDSRSGGSRSSSHGKHRGGRSGRHRHHHRRHSHHRRSRSRSRSLSPDSVSDSESSQSSVDSRQSNNNNNEDEKDSANNMYTKDQRTVFVSQLVQRTVERDIKKFFSKEKGLKVNEVILLRDKRTGRHKGCAYVELRRMEDVSKAVALSNVAPSFQRFPILVKPSEAEKNHVASASGAAVVTPTALTASQMGQKPAPKPLLGPNGQLQEAQKMYLGSLDPSVTQEHLFVLFQNFGELNKVALQCDSAGMSKGFAFLSFHDPKEANLAIQTMANQVLAGRAMKTGWAVNQIASIPNATVVTSDEFPPDSSERATNAYKVLGQLTMGVVPSQINIPATETSTSPAAATTPAVAAPTASGIPRVPTVAEARATLAATASAPPAGNPAALSAAPVVPAQATANNSCASSSSSADPSKVGNADKPTNHILVSNMFDKDQESEPNWEQEIAEEFEEEIAKFGKVVKVKVMSQEIGGKIYASFDTVQGAQSCASSLAGRWFDKRRLAVEFVPESAVPP